MIVMANGEPYSYKTIPELEKWTGADVMISPVSIPVTEKTLQKHIEAGALLVQIKRGLDLLGSIGDRLWSSLERMRKTGARNWQCVLLYAGVFLPDVRDKTCLLAIPKIRQDGSVEWEYYSHPQSVNYAGVVSSLRHWTWYGGVTHHLPSDDMIPAWIEQTENKLIHKRLAIENGAVIKEIWDDVVVSDGDFASDNQELITLQHVNDWRKVLAAFPGVGPVRATALREAMLKAGADDTLFQALVWIVDGREVPGWGKVTRQKVREVLGVPDGYTIEIENEE